MNDVVDKLRDIVMEIVTIDNLEYESSLKSKGVSSLQLLLILNSIEENFAIQIPDDELIMSNFDSLKTISELIEKLEMRSI